MNKVKTHESISVHKDFKRRLEAMRKELVEKAKANGSINADKISLADVLVTAVDFWHSRQK